MGVGGMGELTMRGSKENSGHRGLLPGPSYSMTNNLR